LWDTLGTSKKIWLGQGSNRPQLYLYNDAGSPVVSIASTASQGTVTTDVLTVTYKITFSGVTEYADNAAALAGGLVAGNIYRTGDNLKIVH
jgi:hypothetical protein